MVVSLCQRLDEVEETTGILADKKILANVKKSLEDKASRQV